MVIKINDVNLVEEEAKLAEANLTNSLRKFYRLDTQKVTMNIDLQDPSKPESEENKTCIRGQAVLCFNCTWDSTTFLESHRDHYLDLHWKYMNVSRISLAKRYKKKDEELKVTESLHEREKDLSYSYDLSEFDKFRENSMQKDGIIEDEGDAFVTRPIIQNFCESQTINFFQEKKRGLLRISDVLTLEKGMEYPENVDLVIDYEINDVLDYGLSYRKTNEPSMIGWYLATTHRYFETHYWMPWTDSLKMKNKWKITLITNKSYQVAWSGALEKIIEIEDSDKFAYVYRVDHLTSACKIGWFVGSKFYENDNRYFSNVRRLNDFKKFFVANKKIVFDITETYEQVLGKYFPYDSIDLVFIPNLFVGSKPRRRALWYSGICFLDENLIINESIIEKRFDTYFHLAYAIATNYFGWYIQEAAHTDFWLVEGICQSLAHLYTILKCGFLLYKYKMMKKIVYLREWAKNGLELYSLSSSHLPHASYLQYNDFYFVKAGVIMHILESRIQKEHYHKLLKIIVRDWSKKHMSLSSKDFKKKFKTLCGYSPRFLINWVDFTGALDITLSWEFNKKNNTINLVIDQRNIFTEYLARSKYLNSKLKDNTLSWSNLYSKDYLKFFSKRYHD